MAPAFGEQNDEGGEHAAEDDGHLPFLGKVHGGAATGDGVNDGEEAGADDGEVEPPAEDGGEDDGGRVDGDAGLETALEDEDARAEEAGFAVEALAKILVGGVDAELAVNREKHGADHDQCERETEIILDKGDAVLRGLTGQGEVGDRAGLRRHDGEPDGAPLGRGAALEVGIEVVGVAGAPRAVGGDADDGAEQNKPVEGVHA